jgi:hypothetical protein
MRLERRAFIFGAGAALIARPKLIVSPLPVLYGDGAHDDTAAFHALAKGLPIKLPSGDTSAPKFERGPITLRGGVYLIGAPIVMSRGITFTEAEVFVRFHASKFPGDTAVTIEDGSDWSHSTFHLDLRG